MLLRPPHTRTLLSSLSATALAAATMSTSASASSPAPSVSTTFPSRPYTPRHASWPYKPSDFRRQDEDDDAAFYSAPRFVTHIDDHAIAALGRYYGEALPRRGRILDFCSSWVSHFPRALEDAVRRGELAVVGLGMEERELARNAMLAGAGGGRIVQDLNAAPRVPASVGALDAATCVVSIDYLVRPVEVLRGVRERMRDGGRVHLVVSNRCFPTKAVARWLRVGEEERLQMVGDYLWFAGWRDISIVTLSDGKPDDGGGSGLFGWFSSGTDPLWVVRGTKVGEGVERDEL